jgi:tetratricopeptide (TPR) repeat protein
MKSTVHPIRRLITGTLLLALPFTVSHCAKKTPPPAVRSLNLEELSKAQDLHAYWDRQKPQVPEQVPDERLEALGDMALQKRDFESSLINYLEVLKDHPERYDLHYKVGVIFLMSGKLEPAQKELALVLVHQPEMLQAHEALGLVFLQRKQYPLALDEFRYVLAQDPSRAKTHHLMGVTLLEAGQSDRAITELQKASSLDPRHLSSFLVLSQAYLERKDYQHAIDSLKKAQALSPENQKANRMLGQALAGQKNYPQALTAFLKAGDEAQAYNNIGVYYFMDGRYEEAAKCFQHAMELRPTFYQEAKTNLQRALEKLHESRRDDS